MNFENFRRSFYNDVIYKDDPYLLSNQKLAVKCPLVRKANQMGLSIWFIKNQNLEIEFSVQKLNYQKICEFRISYD